MITDCAVRMHRSHFTKLSAVARLTVPYVVTNRISLIWKRKRNIAKKEMQYMLNVPSERTFLARCSLFAAVLLTSAVSVPAQARFATRADGLPVWVKDVGARIQPNVIPIFSANSFGAVNDGATDSTGAIQRAIDARAKAGGGIITFGPG